jgi:MFS transporter, DHA1 family, inner membrane transport protein
VSSATPVTGISPAATSLSPTVSASPTTATTDRATTPAQVRPTRHVLWATVALAMGGFAIGTTEFVTMGLLPEVARGVGVSIPQAGHMISAYALGVVVGAPVIAIFGARLPRRGLLVALMVAFALANAGSALAQGFDHLTLARFLAGVPHGAYFGLASLVAADLVPPHRRGRAVSRVMLGLPVATVLGVPVGTWMGQHLGWRWVYGVVALIAVLTVVLVLALVPSAPGDRHATSRRELKAFASAQVWLTLLVGAVGFGGMFAMYSYIAPTVTDVTGLSRSAVPVFLLAFGLGAFAGTMLGGRLADWSVLRSLVLSSVAMGSTLALFTFTAQDYLAGVLTIFVVSAVGGVLVVNLQLRLMEVAGSAQTLGAALNHASLNVANALGAWLGGLVIAAGWGYTAPSWVGAGLSLAGLVVLAGSVLLHRRTAPVRVATSV